MTSFNKKLAAGDQFSFSSSSLSGVECEEDYGLAFGEWTGWHCNNYGSSECQYEPEWLAKDDSKLAVDHPSSYEQLSPASRVQVLAKYKQELMEIVQDAPEYVYELSLRDLVELPRIARTAKESPVRERTEMNKARTGGKEKVTKIVRRRTRSESMEGAGYLLKMFFPIPSPGKKRNSISSDGGLTPTSRSSSIGSSSSRSSSSSCRTTKSGSSWKGELPKRLKGGRGADENLEVKSAEMQHGALSRNLSRHQTGCYPFFFNQNKSQTRKIHC